VKQVQCVVSLDVTYIRGAPVSLNSWKVRFGQLPKQGNCRGQSGAPGWAERLCLCLSCNPSQAPWALSTLAPPENASPGCLLLRMRAALQGWVRRAGCWRRTRSSRTRCCGCARRWSSTATSAGACDPAAPGASSVLSTLAPHGGLPFDPRKVPVLWDCRCQNGSGFARK
jgi:hypothetical protein